VRYVRAALFLIYSMNMMERLLEQQVISLSPKPFLVRYAQQPSAGAEAFRTMSTKVDRETTDDQTAEAFAGPSTLPPDTIFTAVDRETTDDQ
jgi:hypothetical protein